MTNTQTTPGLIDVLREAADALAYAAYNFDGSKLDDLPANIVESTGVSETALIAERNVRAAIRALSQQEEPARELESMKRMFHAACADLGLINEALGLDPDDGGAEPILDAIEELKAKAEPQPAQPTPNDDYNGWYCAHCQCGVDVTEVTYREQHTACGRVITNDRQPAQPTPELVPADAIDKNMFRLHLQQIRHCAATDLERSINTFIGYLQGELPRFAKHVQPLQKSTPVPAEQAAQKAIAFDEWIEKTNWVHEQISTFPVSALGKHRADVMREEIERLRAMLKVAQPAQQPPAQQVDLLRELDWCIAEGNTGPRSHAALVKARAALSSAPSEQDKVDTLAEFIRRHLKRFDGDEGCKDLYAFRPGENLVEADSEDEAVATILAARAAQEKANEK